MLVFSREEDAYLMVIHRRIDVFERSDRQSLERSPLPDRKPESASEDFFRCEECQTLLWKAGEIVPAGIYTRVDDRSYRAVVLEQEGPLPATFDGHIALYCTSACACRDHALHTHSWGERSEQRNS